MTHIDVAQVLECISSCSPITFPSYQAIHQEQSAKERENFLFAFAPHINLSLFCCSERLLHCLFVEQVGEIHSLTQISVISRSTPAMVSSSFRSALRMCRAPSRLCASLFSSVKAGSCFCAAVMPTIPSSCSAWLELLESFDSPILCQFPGRYQEHTPQRDNSLILFHAVVPMSFSKSAISCCLYCSIFILFSLVSFPTMATILSMQLSSAK